MPTLTLTVYLYDTGNASLHHPGITIDLYDATTTVLLATAASHDLNPHPSGVASNEWGGKLAFAAPLGNPIDVLFTDAKYEYPGNTLRFLNSDQAGPIHVDLQKVPTRAGGHRSPPVSASPATVVRWVDTAPRWSPEEKEAVKRLVFNYCAVVVSRRDDPNRLASLARVADNWGTALHRLGIPPHLLNGA